MPPDYSGQNLRGRSFKGQDLTGANFSKADIRGANFTNAILKDADFTGAKAGLQRRWVIGLLIATLLMSALSGFFSIIIGTLIALILNPENSENFIIGIVSLVIVIVFCIVTISKGLTAAAYAGAIVFAFTGTIAFAFTGTGAAPIAVAVAGVTFGTAALAGLGAFVGAGTRAEAAAIAGAFIGATIGFLVVVVIGARTLAVVVGGAVAIVLLLFIAYISCLSFTGDERYALIGSFAIAFAATGGTSFRGADLTDADFTGATLKNTDFRKANLTRTRFYKAKKLDFARPGNTILANPAVLNLLVTLNGRNKSYVGANLRGANLIDADLKNANLKDADIVEATFKGACLEWANLSLTQAVGTNFTNAQMTGACVEAWNIESTTILDNVDCRFVYLLENPKPGTDDRERRPSSGEFQPGEFTKLFEEVLNTVDLIFRNGIDWKAFVNAFGKVQNQNQDTELSIQSIENKGDGVIVVKVNAPEGADKEKIHRDFTENYQLALQAVEEKYKALLQAKDELLEEKNKRIEDNKQQYSILGNITEILADKQINVQQQIIQEIKQMTNSSDYSRNVEV
ncbi:pentapeptide repeat-containing protein [Sphaerospermopsis torques-reginae]|uniref:Pentapeptide repeat-containing protein n=1 Tax=Sphaerospermopsis torques-reginae ITEP-024 TaxID=984208 RepID=A0ABX8WWC7_9CYAN|nr:pentapeptide repeat-containing protein [Sphaerospermopsis torques-reginae ITEP-024]